MTASTSIPVSSVNFLHTSCTASLTASPFRLYKNSNVTPVVDVAYFCALVSTVFSTVLSVVFSVPGSSGACEQPANETAIIPANVNANNFFINIHASFLTVTLFVFAGVCVITV